MLLADKFTILNHFSCTLSYKFARMTYEKIRELIAPKIMNVAGFEFCNKRSVKGLKRNVSVEVYILLRNAINTIPPYLFEAYLKAFSCGNYAYCYYILEKFICCDESCEKNITDCICQLNRFKSCVPISCVVFFDTCSKAVHSVETCCSPCESPVCLYLPKQVLCFEEFLCFSFCLDELILKKLALATNTDYSRVYIRMIKEYYNNFPALSEEDRVIAYLRIKFFAFNAIAYQVSYITSDIKRDCIGDLLTKIRKCTSGVFFKCFAEAMGLLNK